MRSVGGAGRKLGDSFINAGVRASAAALESVK